MNNSLISIIMPAYNAESTIEKAIASVLSQDYSNYELIIVDDGSVDNTLDVCTKRCDSRIRIVSQGNMGLSGARNTGLKLAQGEFICFVDSDDWVEPSYLSSLYFGQKEENADLVICGLQKDQHESQYRITFLSKQTYRNCIDNEDFLRLFEGGLINSCCNKLYKKEKLKRENLRFSGKTLVEDLEFNLKYLVHTNSVSVITECPYHYVQQENSLTTYVSEDMLENYMYIQKQFKQIVSTPFHPIVNRFVYHQYMSVFLRYMMHAINGRIKKKEVVRILDEYLSKELINEAFTCYSPSSYKESLIYYALKWRWYGLIFLFLLYKKKG